VEIANQPTPTTPNATAEVLATGWPANPELLLAAGAVTAPLQSRLSLAYTYARIRSSG
jgi:hypothetical protein